MSSAGQEIKRIRLERGISQNQLAKSAGISQAGLSAIENATKSPNIDTLGRIANVLGVSTDYLLGRTDYSDIPAPTTKGKWIPVLGCVQAGIPIEAVEDIIGYEEISNEMAQSGDYFALRIRGDSMEPRMHEGDVVIVRKQDDAETGDVCVVMVNGDDATVKRIKKSPEGLFLIANNPAFEPMFFSNREIDELPVQVIGKVVELRAKF